MSIFSTSSSEGSRSPHIQQQGEKRPREEEAADLNPGVLQRRGSVALFPHVDVGALGAFAEVAFRHDSPNFPLMAEEFRQQFNSLKHRVVLADDSVYKGVLEDGIPEGRGKLETQSGEIYKGAFKAGRIFYGKVTYPNGDRYDGQFKNSLPHGNGVMIKDGNRFKGTFERGNLISGKTIINKSWTYRGQFKDFVPEGRGTLTAEDGSIFIGDFVEGIMEWGTINYSSGDQYIGKLKAGQFHGEGKLIKRDGTFEGVFNEGVLNRGKITFENDKVYEGELLYWQPHGEGTLSREGGRTFIGKFEFGKFIEGKIFYPDGDVYEGKMNEDGDFHGQGTLFIKKTGKTFTGEFINGDLRYGTIKKADGQYTYEGEIKKSAPNGSGTQTWKSGSTFTGQFKNKQIVSGKATYSDGRTYTGEFKDWKPNGQGKLVTAEGITVEGIFEGGRAVVGKSALTYPNQDLYRGEIHRWKPHGTGTLIKKDGTTFSGQFENGIFIKNIKKEKK